MTTQQGRIINQVNFIQTDTPKHDWEFAGAVERLEERCRQMNEEQGEENIPGACKMAATRHLLVGDFKRRIALREDELRTCAEMKAFVMKSAVLKTLKTQLMR